MFGTVVFKVFYTGNIQCTLGPFTDQLLQLFIDLVNTRTYLLQFLFVTHTRYQLPDRQPSDYPDIQHTVDFFNLFRNLPGYFTVDVRQGIGDVATGFVDQVDDIQIGLGHRG